MRRNRNRVEFKELFQPIFPRVNYVDIETEWNLKVHRLDRQERQEDVDIETEWNLKAIP